LLEERDLGRLLAGQKGLPFVEVSASDAEPAALELLSEDNARHQVALPLRHEGGQLVVAVADPSNELMLENLRRTLGAPPKLVVAPYAELIKAIAEAYARPRPEVGPELEIVVSEPEAPQPETQPEPQAEVERAPARPLPIMLRPKASAAEHKPASPRLVPMLPAPPASPEPQAPVAQRPPAPELILELPPDWPSAGEEPAEEPVSPAPPPEEPAPEPAAQEEPVSLAPPPEEPAPEAPGEDEPAALTTVILRLQDGTTLEVGTFPTVAEAAAEAQEVVIEIAAADRSNTWPFFAQRYLRPDLIISVDLVEQSSVNDGLRRSQR
jgi:hypothetical protein